KNTQSIKQIKIYVKEIPCLYLASPLTFNIVETNASYIGYGSNLKQLVDNKEQLVQLTALYSEFYIVYLMTPNSILTKVMNKLFQDCRKLYLYLDVNQIHFQSLSLTEIENRNLTHRLLQGNETLKTNLALLCAFKKFLACETIEFYLCVHENTLCANHSMHEKENFLKTFICKNIFPFVLQEMESIEDTLFPTEIKKNMNDTLFLIMMKTLSVQIPFTDKLLFNNSNPTYPSPYKKSSFFHSFIEKPEIMETLPFDRATERKRKRKLPSPTEIEENLRFLPR
ncbi:hypothetical protein CFOL_v3_12794, partial [Cephalotus follicularis]